MTTLKRDVKYGTWWRDYYVFDEISVETAIQDILSDNIDPVLTEPIFGNHDELLEMEIINDSDEIIYNKTYNTAWCVFNVYEDNSKELSSIHTTMDKALESIENNKNLLDKLNKCSSKHLQKQIVEEWCIM
jgi:hypothetical protein